MYPGLRGEHFGCLAGIIASMRRFLSLALALSLVGYFVAQEPISVADAYPPYDESANGSGYQRVQTAGYVAGGYVVYRTITGTGFGSLARRGSTQVGGGNGSLYELIQSKPDEFRALTQILRNTSEADTYQSRGPYTVFWPTDAALTRALGAERVALLQRPAGQQAARHLIASLTVPGSYSLERLRALATSGTGLTTLTGEAVELKLDGNTLTANGVAILQTEYPARNGFLLTADGLIVPE